MPFFSGSSDFKIHGGEFNDVSGNLTKNHTNHAVTNTDSNNSYSESSINSHNDGSATAIVDGHGTYLSFYFPFASSVLNSTVLGNKGVEPLVVEGKMPAFR